METPRIRGRFDGFRGNMAYGWIWSPDRPDHRIVVRLLVDGEALEEKPAARMRGDLRDGGIGDGGHGFEFFLPEGLRDGRVHRISVVNAETGQELPYSPRDVGSGLFMDREALQRTAPWPDQPEADRMLFEKMRAGVLTYEDYRRLTFWRENGYLLLEQAVDPQLIDHCNRHVDVLLQEKLPVSFVRPGIPPTLFSEVEHEGPFAGTRFLEFHTVSQAAAQLSMHPEVMRFLSLVFEDTPACMQSLLFIAGTQQRAHQDYPYVHTPRPAFLAASWIALEDVHPDAGPLFYYPGSHRAVQPFDFGFGNTLAFGDGPHIRDFEEHLQQRCDRLKLERRLLTIRKGDLLIWHYALVHGGSPVADLRRTRRSLVTHFSARSVYDRDRKYPGEAPIVREVNGGVYYDFKPGDYPVNTLRLSGRRPAAVKPHPAPAVAR